MRQPRAPRQARARAPGRAYRPGPRTASPPAHLPTRTHPLAPPARPQAGQLSLQALPDYAALVKSGGEVTDVTVAAVTAAASAAAAAAAAAVVAAAGKEIETKLQVGWAAGLGGAGQLPACARAGGARPAATTAGLRGL